MLPGLVEGNANSHDVQVRLVPIALSTEVSRASFADMSAPDQAEGVVSITPLLKRLWPAQDDVTASEIASAVSHIFTNSLTPVQTGALLTALHFTGFDTHPDVLARCSQAMRNASAYIDKKAIRETIRKRGRKEGSYKGGLVRLSTPILHIF